MSQVQTQSAGEATKVHGTPPARRGPSRFPRFAEWAAILGGAMVIGSVFLDWYKLSAGGNSATFTLGHAILHPFGRFGAHTAQWLAHVDWLALLLGGLCFLIGVGLAIRRWRDPEHPRPVPASLHIFGAAGLIYVTFRALLGPGNFLGVSSIHTSIGPVHFTPQPGLFLGLAGFLLITVGAYHLHEHMPAAGWKRAGIFTVLGLVFAYILTGVIRYAMHEHGAWIDADAVTTVCLIAVPLFFLVGLGAFDYWFYWAAGRPTRPEDHSSHGAHSWRDYFRVNTDHKVIGVQYVVNSFVFLFIGGMLAMLMRAELAQPGQQFVDAQTFNGLFSVHASLLIFLFIIPVFAGLANFVLPLMIGAPDMAFPRLNALSFWLLPIAGIMMVASFIVPGGAFASGWTAYAPLSTTQPLGQLFFTIAVQFAGASSIATALNFLVTIITMRAPGMSFFRMPLLVWANFSTSLLVVIATPFIAASQFFVLLDRALGFEFFNIVGAGKNGNVLMYQHVFWFYSHPAVYIMMLPGFGIISEVIAVKARKPIFGYRMMAFSLLAIVVLGFTVWAHHMFVSGMQAWIRIPMMITTAIIAVPTGIKIFSWLATLWKGVLHLDTPMLFALGFLTMFTLGGISGVMLAMIPFTIHVSDTYFIVAHIHYVLFGGSLFTIFAGVYYWFPKMTGRMYNERLGKFHFWATFIFFNATFGPMHVIGIQGMPRRVADYAQKFAAMNLFISIASFLLGLSMLVFLYNMVSSWRGGPRASGNPWRALTLEWQVSSPPPIFNFDNVPTVVGGPYEYGVPGAVHGIFQSPQRAQELSTAAGGGGLHPPPSQEAH